MAKIQLTPRRVLELIIAGIRNGNLQAAIDVAQDCIDQLPEDALDPEIYCSCGGKWRTDGQHQNRFCDKCFKPHRKESIMGEKKLYIGSKLIKAYPMDRNEFLENKGDDKRVDPDQQGYCVEYPDGYISWSPKEVFETAYREVTDAERELSGSCFD